MRAINRVGWAIGGGLFCAGVWLALDWCFFEVDGFKHYNTVVWAYAAGHGLFPR